MIRKSRGVIFGTRGKTQGQQFLNAGNAYRQAGNMPTQFGRTASGHKPIFGGRTTSMRRR